MMAMKRPWGNMDPNSDHQLWSKWIFTVAEIGKHMPFADVKHNAARWIKMAFSKPIGRMKVEEHIRSYVITADIEGLPANDPEFIQIVKLQFQRDFVDKGWGLGAEGCVNTTILAGDEQDGKPAKQLAVMAYN